MTFHIRPTAPSDWAGWSPLWQAYLTFYGASISDAVTAATWARILDPQKPIHGLVAEAPDGRLIGFANYVMHEGTWDTRPLCYLEDLFVAPDGRGQGVGRALIDTLIDRAKSEDWGRVYWFTATDNTTARRLYDTYTKADDFVIYRLEFEDRSQATD